MHRSCAVQSILACVMQIVCCIPACVVTIVYCILACVVHRWCAVQSILACVMQIVCCIPACVVGAEFPVALLAGHARPHRADPRYTAHHQFGRRL